MRVSFPAHHGTDPREMSIPEAKVDRFRWLLEERIWRELGGVPVRVYPDWDGAGEVSADLPAPVKQPGGSPAVLDMERVRSDEEKLRRLRDELLSSDQWRT
jgi:hypothetical protein